MFETTSSSIQSDSGNPLSGLQIFQGRKTLWLADDNPGDVELIRLAAAECNPPWTLRAFRNGGELLAEARRGCDANIIVLDMNMPILDGWETSLLLRSMLLRPVPIVVMSSSTVPTNSGGSTPISELRDFAGIESWQGRFLRNIQFRQKPVEHAGLVRFLQELSAMGT
jgi:CheY-like chemotaxis protein